jgi:hypothetical protein
MKTFFSRHSSGLDIDRNTLNYLWDNDYIAIHYPETKNGNKEIDTRSLNPSDYETSGKKALNALLNISTNGGYVFGVYENQSDYKVGIIEPNTQIELVEGKWGDRAAVLKCLKFSKSITLKANDAISLICAQPRQGTLCHWKAVGSRVENLFKDKNNKKNISDLTPDLQEVMCSEYLRIHVDNRLPKLISLLAPIGRTLKDVDIFGLAKEGKKIICQVTYLNEPVSKIEKLRKYKNEDNDILILFSKTNNPRIENNIIIY